jgi:hypothetical protein
LIAEQELAALILNLAKGIEGFLRQEIMSDMARWLPTTGTPQGAVLCESFEVETLATQAVTELRAEFNILKLHAVRERRSSKDRLPWRPKTADSWM